MTTALLNRSRFAPPSSGIPRAAEFLTELPTVIAELAASAAKGNRQVLGRLAHQLKESGELSGYDDLTPFAARLERVAVGNGTPLDIRVALDDLIAECGKMRAGCAV
ncbi:MAG: Hpt domain-containing protein [Planctomycetales bacterium]|nr:Hpt domain-containing protein [Planctomycetales bacterium]